MLAKIPVKNTIILYFFYMFKIRWNQTYTIYLFPGIGIPDLFQISCNSKTGQCSSHLLHPSAQLNLKKKLLKLVITEAHTNLKGGGALFCCHPPSTRYTKKQTSNAMQWNALLNNSWDSALVCAIRLNIMWFSSIAWRGHSETCPLAFDFECPPGKSPATPCFLKSFLKYECYRKLKSFTWNLEMYCFHSQRQNSPNSISWQISAWDGRYIAKLLCR